MLEFKRREFETLKRKLPKSTSGQKTFHSKTVSIWNNIETSIKFHESVVNVKNKLKHFYNFLDHP